MNNLKLVIKTTCIARHLSDYAVLPPHVNVFRQPAVASWKLSEHHLLLQFLQLSTNQHSECQQLALQVEKLSCLVSIESFEFLTPLKMCFTYDGSYEL
jgi:hypothetical protein